MDRVLSGLLSGYTTLFILDDVIADESLDKHQAILLDLAISEDIRDHYLWMLTQSYTGIPKNLRRQAKQLFIWYPKEWGDFRLIHEENDVLTNEEIPLAKTSSKVQNMPVSSFAWSSLDPGAF